MFDVGFSELMLCFIVALVVLGPERLPGVARAVGRWTGQAKSYLRNLSAELDRETQIGELKRQLEQAKATLQDRSAELESSLQETRTQLANEASDIQRSIEPPKS